MGSVNVLSGVARSRCQLPRGRAAVFKYTCAASTRLLVKHQHVHLNSESRYLQARKKRAISGYLFTVLFLSIHLLGGPLLFLELSLILHVVRDN